PPTLTVNTTTAIGGSAVTAILTGSAGGAQDWLALAATGAADTNYLQWTYVGAGVTSRTWTVTMPSAGGTFEFRLYLNGGSTRAATSPTLTVTPGPPPPAPAPSVNATNRPAGARLPPPLPGRPGRPY